MTIETLQAAKDLENQLRLVKEDLDHLRMMLGAHGSDTSPEHANSFNIYMEDKELRVRGITIAQKQELIKVVTGMLLVNQTILTAGIGAL